MTETSATQGILSEMTIEEVKDFDPEVVMLGIASTEPHGPHLPYGTDTYQSDGLCRRAVTKANERGARVLLYPTLPIGNNVNFKGYPFACRIGVRTLMNVVLDIIEAIEEEGVRKIVLLNGHGGNTDTLRATLREHAGRHDPGEGAFVCTVQGFFAMPEDTADLIEHPSSHAGELETSRMMYLRPDLVREELMDTFSIMEPTIDALEDDAIHFVPRWDAHMPASAGGKTNKCSRAKGEALVEEGAGWIADLLVELDAASVDEMFPYPSEE